MTRGQDAQADARALGRLFVAESGRHHLRGEGGEPEARAARFLAVCHTRPVELVHRASNARHRPRTLQSIHIWARS